MVEPFGRAGVAVVHEIALFVPNGPRCPFNYKKEIEKMPQGRHVRLIIAPDGSCSVDAVNFSDASCLSVTREITFALGGAVRSEHLKPEARVRERCGHSEREHAR